MQAYEPITIFKLGVLLNQMTRNELSMSNGFKQMLVDRGEPLFFKEAMLESIDMGIKEIDFADPNFIEDVLAWAKRNRIPYEEIEKELSRTFQRPLSDFNEKEEE